MSQNELGYCLAPFIALAICCAFPFVIWTTMDVLSGTDKKNWAINTCFNVFDDD